MSALIPVDAPTLAPLRESFEYDQLESELKAAFMAVFESMLRARERRLNLYGMPHLGDDELIEQAMKDAGLSIVRRNSTRTSFLLKAAKARNPRRGMIFLRQYLQSVWPNVWKVEPLWHPIATAANYPADRTPLGVHDLSGGVTAEYAGDSETGIPTLYRNDWQGKQLLHTTPRTNLLTHSTTFGQSGSGWYVGPNSTVSVGTDGPDGGPTTIVHNTRAGGTYVSHAYELRQGRAVTSSIWWRGQTKPTTGYVLLLDIRNADNEIQRVGKPFSDADVIADGQWRRYTLTATSLGSDESSLGAYFLVDTGEFDLEGFGPQLEDGPVATSYIPTGDKPATVTDYTVDDNGVATFAGGAPDPTPITHFRTGRIRITLPVTTDNGLGLVEIAKAFRPTLAPRLMLELRLSTVMENIGEGGGLALANGAKGVMPFMAIGTLKRS